jgi:hypothetical protein
LWGRFFSRWTDPFADGNTAEGIVYLGVVVLILATVGLWRNWRRGRMWAALAGVFGLLSLGPYLKVLNHNTGVPLPYWILAHLPIVSFTRVPSRYVVWMQLALAVLTGLGIVAILERFFTAENAEASANQRTPRKPSKNASRPQRLYGKTSARLKEKLPCLSTWWQGWPALVVLAMILVDYAVMPYPTTPATIPPFYQELGQDPETYALLELPLQRPASPWYYTKWMLHQTVHGKDSFRGYISRGDPLFSFGGTPFLRQLAGLGERDITYDDWQPLATTVLSYYRVGYVVLEQARLEEQGEWERTQRLVQEVLAVARPAYEDDELETYAVQWGANKPFLVLNRGWHEVEEQSWGPFRWIEKDRADLYVILPQAQRVSLSFQAVSFLRPRRLEIVRNDQVIASLEIATTLQPYSVTLDLRASTTQLELRTDGYDIPRVVGAGEDTRAVSVGFSMVRIRGR